jgi:putative hemolysin
MLPSRSPASMDPLISSILIDFSLILLFTLINAVFAAVELALVSVNEVRMRMMADQGDRRARLVLRATEDRTKFLATMQIGISLASALGVAFGASTLAPKLATLMTPLLGGLAISVATIGFTLFQSVILNIILGELVPKRLAIRNVETVALASIKPITLIGKLTSPVVKLLSFCTDLILRLLGAGGEDDEESVSAEEIKAIVDAGRADGVVSEQERRIIHGAVELSQITVRAIMVPRVQIQYIKADSPLEEAYSLVAENAHTRLPVCKGDLDSIIGILHVKDLIRPLEQLQTAPPQLGELLRPVYYVPETMLVHDLLESMKENRLHLAIVRDEFGGTAGVVTLEDVLEEIVGEIRDEYDAEEEGEFRQISPHEGIFKLRASLSTVNNELDLELPRDEVATLAGLFLEELDRPAVAGDVVVIDQVRLEVLEDGQRVQVGLQPIIEPQN